MFVQPTGQGITLLVVISVLHPLATVAIILRLWARYTINAIGTDDWLMVLGWATQIASCIATYISLSYGAGTHAWRVPDKHSSQQAMKWNLVGLMIYTAATAPIKTSICVLLLRIAPQRIYRCILYGLIVISVAGSVAAIIVYCTICQPVSAVWNGKGRCEPSDYSKFARMIRIFGVLCIITDWTCALLPAVMLWNVRLSRKAKMYVAGMLALGVFASIATIARMGALSQREQSDHLYTLIPVALWSDVECCFGIIAGCLATMRPLLRVFGIHSSGISKSGEPSLGRRMHTIKTDGRSNGPELDSPYRVIIETEGGRKGEEGVTVRVRGER